MSHQTGTAISTLPAHIMAFIAYIMFMTKNQPMIESVATFRARQCHGKGKMSERAARRAIGANSGCIIVGSVEGSESCHHEFDPRIWLHDFRKQSKTNNELNNGHTLWQCCDNAVIGQLCPNLEENESPGAQICTVETFVFRGLVCWGLWSTQN